MITVPSPMPEPHVLTPAENGAKLLHESGLIFKINRQVLHPLGLALYFTQNDDGTFNPGLGVLESPGHEPIEFEPNPERDAERQAWFDAFLAKRWRDAGSTP